MTRTSDQTYKLAFLNRGLPLKATSLLRTDLEFWTAPDGEEYWHEQVRSRREGFTIQRVFICQARTDAVTELVQRRTDVVETSRQYERILRVATPVPSARSTADVIARLEREGVTLAID